mgnify:CR=1 FL=1
MNRIALWVLAIALWPGCQVSMAATDGFRLSVKSIQLPETAPEPFEVIIPARALNELARIVDESVDEEGSEEPDSEEDKTD